MKTVLKFLERQLLVRLKSDHLLHQHVMDWFTALSVPGDAHIDGNRFLLCLAIDIKNQLLSPDVIICVLKNMDFNDPASDLIRQFDLLIVNDLDKYFVHSSCNNATYGRKKYATVMGWSGFYNKTRTKLRIPLVIPGLNNEILYYNLFFTQKVLTLGKVKEWIGLKDLTWVTPYNELKQFMRKKMSVEEIMDALGLESLDGLTASGRSDRVVYVEYPDDFDHSSSQPTTLCGCWLKGGGLYLSYRMEDGHGRTYSTSGTKRKSKERVIKERDYSTGDFKLFDLGQQEKALIKDRSKIVSDGIKRFKQAPKKAK